MKIKELKKTVNVSWSPAEHYPLMLAAGSAAQQVDATFSTNSHLELYSLNLEDSSLDFELKASIPTQQKFHKLAWSAAGVIVGGFDGGLLEFYNSEKLLKNGNDALVGSSSKHTGHVSALDINPYQENLLASGASDSEIFIWDLNNTSQPMAPGNKSQPYDHVQGLAWNQQVQHILGSTLATRCLVWDLRKNEPIMKLSDSQCRTRWRALAWHPAVATQLCIASEDDQAPVIQLWDLRLAASPLVTLEGHEKGVLSLSWSRHDEDLLVSAGKDGRLLAWNPNNTTPGGEMVCEVSRQSAWVLEGAWSPRAPGLLAAAAFDHSLALHALLPTSGASSTSSTNNILESFGGADGLAALPAVCAAPAPARRPQPAHAPKWLRRPVAGRFAFGGKLVTFEKCPQEAGPQKLVYISQVVSEPEVVERASELDTVLALTQSQEPGAAEKLAEYCGARGAACAEQAARSRWFLLRACFRPSFREDVLDMLGYKDDEPSKFKGPEPRAPDAGLSRGESTETEAELSTDTSTDLSDAQTLIERKLANVELEPAANIVIPNGDEGGGAVCRALLRGRLQEAAALCVDDGRLADALVIASLGSPELQYKVAMAHVSSRSECPVALLAGCLLAARWDPLVASAAARCWRSTLAALVAHCDSDSLAHYCEMLGDKLAKESDPELQQAASLCYVCAAHADALAARALRDVRASGGASVASGVADVTALARGAELALLARAAAAVRGQSVSQGAAVEALLSEYAQRLCAQGCLRSAHAVLRGGGGGLALRLAAALGEQQSEHQQQQQQYRQHGQQQQRQQQAARSRTASTHSHARGQYGAQNDAINYNSAAADGGWSAPPRPPSAASQPGGITSRSKYKVDPSVQSAPYNQYGFSNPIQSQPAYGYNSPYPDQYASSTVSSHNFTPINQPKPMQPINPTNQPNPMNPLNPVNSPNPVNTINPAPLNQLNPVNPPQAMNQMTSAVNGSYYSQEPQPMSKPAAPGWNDPPMMTAKPKPREREHMCAEHAGTRRWGRQRGRLLQPKQELQQQAPITHPLFGVEAPQHVPLVPSSQYPGQNQFPGQQAQQQNQYPGHMEQLPVQVGQFPGQPGQFVGQPGQFPGQPGQFPGQPGQFPGQPGQLPGQLGQLPGQPGQFLGQQYPGQYQDQYPGQYPGVNQPGYPQQAESPAPEPVAKAPLPEEHRELQAVFDSLKDACAERAANPQMKRKLDDVQRRLEHLYDLLRENRLSESALSALHACAQQLRRGQGEGALQAVTSLATGADFSAAASFLPGLKVLLLLAAQLHISLS